MPIVEAVLVELDLQRLVRDEDEVGNFDPKKNPKSPKFGLARQS